MAPGARGLGKREDDDMPEVGEGMRDADLLMWMGDFNYR